MSLKVCTVCKQEKDTVDFNSNGYTPIGTKKLKPMCKPCESSGKKQASKALLAELVEMKCVRCGYDTCVSAIEFHHVHRGTKDFNIGSQRIADVNKIKTEISKCVVLCSNCHRELHAGLFTAETLPRALESK